MANSFSVTEKPPGRPEKTWDNAVLELLTARRLSEVDALNTDTWCSRIQGRPPTSASWDKAATDDGECFRKGKWLILT